MFRWILPDHHGLLRISEQFCQMLDDGLSIFNQASDTLLAGADADPLNERIWAIDRRINATEQLIRRELVVHMAVAGGADAHACLRLMSLVKDAERIGDYAKNILELAQRTRSFPSDPLIGEMTSLRTAASQLLSHMRGVYEQQDEGAARAFCEQADQLLKRCESNVDALLRDASRSQNPVAMALMFRHVKRVLAHGTNIVSAIFMPLDKLDYFDEKPRDR